MSMQPASSLKQEILIVSPVRQALRNMPVLCGLSISQAPLKLKTNTSFIQTVKKIFDSRLYWELVFLSLFTKISLLFLLFAY